MQNDFNQVFIIAEAGTYYSRTYPVAAESDNVDVAIALSALTGSGTTVDLTVEYSDDESTWTEGHAFDQQTSAPATLAARTGANGEFFRIKAVVAGGEAAVEFSVNMQARVGGGSTATAETGGGNPFDYIQLNGQTAAPAVTDGGIYYSAPAVPTTYLDADFATVGVGVVADPNIGGAWFEVVGGTLATYQSASGELTKFTAGGGGPIISLFPQNTSGAISITGTIGAVVADYINVGIFLVAAPAGYMLTWVSGNIFITRTDGVGSTNVASGTLAKNPDDTFELIITPTGETSADIEVKINSISVLTYSDASAPSIVFDGGIVVLGVDDSIKEPLTVMAVSAGAPGMKAKIDGSEKTLATTEDIPTVPAVLPDLSDFPSSYTGQASKTLAVKGDESGVEFISLPTSLSLYDATVADSGADYTDLQAAITAGKRRLLVTGNLAQTGNASVPTADEVLIHVIKGATITMSDGQHFVTDIVGTSNLILEGRGNINWAWSVMGELVEQANVGNKFIVRPGLTFNNSSTVNSASLCMSGIIIMDDTVLNLPNQSNSGVKLTERTSHVDKLTLNGGGSACSAGLILDAGAGNVIVKATNINVIGTFDTAANAISCPNPYSELHHVAVSASSFPLNISTAGRISHVTDQTGGTNVVLTASDQTTDHLYLGSGGLTVGGYKNAISDVNGDGAFVLTGSNMKINNLLSSSGAVAIAGDDNEIVNIEVSGGDLNVSGNRNMITNPKTPQAMSISGNHNRLIAPSVGALASGKTITVETGATKNVVVAALTDVAIVDSGTSSSVATGAVTLS